MLILIFLALILLYPYIRLLIKRICLMIKIKHKCRQIGLEFFAPDIFWFLGGIKGDNCDFYIVSQEKIFAVKLAYSISKSYYYHFVSPERYDVKSMRFHSSFTRMSARFVPRKKKKYKFDYLLKDEWILRDKVNILLFNPVPGGVYVSLGNDIKEIWNGDNTGEAYFYNLTGFLSVLDSQNGGNDEKI